jgi:FtsH-binding integral membrane protein
MPTAGLLFHCPALPKQRLSNPATITGMPEFSATKGPIQSRNRVTHALLVAAKGFVITAAKTFYALWLETTGLMYAVLTVGGGSALVWQFKKDHLADHRRFLIVAAFTLVCGWFTIFSFVKAKRTRR